MNKTRSKYNARVYSKLGQSGSIFGLSLIENKPYYRIKVLSADMATPAGLDRFKSMFPESFHNVGIAEQNMIGIAAGLSSEGFKCITVAQAAFISMRSFEQVRQYMGYMHNNIIAVGISSGFALTFFGNTHYAIEDLNLMRGIPNMVVLSPADSGEAVKAFESALKLDNPVYIRITGGLNNPIVYKEDFEYEIGKAIEIQKGADIAIIATGSMVYQSIEVQKYLKMKLNITPQIIDMHTIKPLDSNTLEGLRNFKLIVTIEEHNIIGGLGSAVSEYFAEQSGFPPLLKIGINDKFGLVGDYNFLLEHHRLTPELIAEDIITKFES